MPRDTRFDDPVYTAWANMNRRCRSPEHPDFANYGGRGITVCDRWRVFVNFAADVGGKPSPSHTLDRIDNERGYEPGNVRWATRKEQVANRRGPGVRGLVEKHEPVQMQWLRSIGVPVRDIARFFEITIGAVYRILKRHHNPFAHQSPRAIGAGGQAR